MATSSPMTTAQRTGLRNLGARLAAKSEKSMRARDPMRVSLEKTYAQGPAPKGSMLTKRLKKKGLQTNHR